MLSTILLSSIHQKVLLWHLMRKKYYYLSLHYLFSVFLFARKKNLSFQEKQNLICIHKLSHLNTNVLET